MQEGSCAYFLAARVFLRGKVTQFGKPERMPLATPLLPLDY